MPDPNRDAIRARLAACPDIRPRVTVRGAIYLAGGPFDPETASSLVHFLLLARRDMAYLLGNPAEPETGGGK